MGWVGIWTLHLPLIKPKSGILFRTLTLYSHVPPGSSRLKKDDNKSSNSMLNVFRYIYSYLWCGGGGGANKPKTIWVGGALPGCLWNFFQPHPTQWDTKSFIWGKKTTKQNQPPPYSFLSPLPPPGGPGPAPQFCHKLIWERGNSMLLCEILSSHPKQSCSHILYIGSKIHCHGACALRVHIMTVNMILILRYLLVWGPYSIEGATFYSLEFGPVGPFSIWHQYSFSGLEWTLLWHLKPLVFVIQRFGFYWYRA